jgi:hypothetical protein
MDNYNRTLSVFADGEPVTSSARTKLLGHEGLGLYPSLFMLKLSNLAEEDYLLLSRAREVEVKHGEVVLVSGMVSDVFRNTKRNGTETHVAVSPGLALWEAVVSVDVESGTTVSETIRRLLEASGTGIQLLSFPGEDPASIRGQAFFGRAAECIEVALTRRNVGDGSLVPGMELREAVPLFRRCCLVPSGLCVIPKVGLPVSIVLTEEDLQEVPAFNCGGDMILRTGPAGWTLGKYVEVRYGGLSSKGLISERLLNLDTGDGPWRVELIVEIHNS